MPANQGSNYLFIFKRVSINHRLFPWHFIFTWHTTDVSMATWSQRNPWNESVYVPYSSLYFNWTSIMVRDHTGMDNERCLRLNYNERPLRFLTLLPLWESVLTLWELGSLWLPHNSNTASNQSTSIGRQWCFQKKNKLWSLGNFHANTFTKKMPKRFKY